MGNGGMTPLTGIRNFFYGVSDRYEIMGNGGMTPLTATRNSLL
jgi:hypothetical protein